MEISLESEGKVMYQGGEQVKGKQFKLEIFCDNKEQRAEMQDLLDTLKRRMYERRTCNALHKALQAIITQDN